MAYALTLESAAVSAPVLPRATSPELRRLRRVVAYGPRCPDCAGPLVFGEGCQLCPICGYSGCGAGG